MSEAREKIKVLVKEAKALETKIADELDNWTVSYACLLILPEDAVDRKHEIEESATKYAIIQNIRNELQEKKKKITCLLKTTNYDKTDQAMNNTKTSTDEQVEQGR